MDSWQLQRTISHRLLILNVANIAAGIALLSRDKLRRAIGTQAIAWGLINVSIALIGGLFNERRRATLPDPYRPEVMQRDAANLSRLLWFNTGLDVLYMIGGWVMARSKPGDDSRRGSGLGVILQGALLFLFDLFHAQRIPH